METCARAAEKAASNSAPSTTVLMKIFISGSLPDLMLSAQARSIFCNAIYNCERHSWPQVQVDDPALERRDPGSTYDLESDGPLIVTDSFIRNERWHYRFLWPTPVKSSSRKLAQNPGKPHSA
jgi:hypothetical protein